MSLLRVLASYMFTVVRAFHIIQWSVCLHGCVYDPCTVYKISPAFQRSNIYKHLQFLSQMVWVILNLPQSFLVPRLAQFQGWKFLLTAGEKKESTNITIRGWALTFYWNAQYRRHTLRKKTSVLRCFCLLFSSGQVLAWKKNPPSSTLVMRLKNEKPQSLD